MDSYDAGLLNDFGGGAIGWWQDYIRAELSRAEDFYREQYDRLTAQLAEAKTANLAIRSERDQALAQLYSQLTEAKASAESWQENCRLTEDELEKERNKHAETIGKLAGRDGAITCYNEVLAELREEVEKLRHQSINWVPVFDENMELQAENAALREEVENTREANLQLAGAAICPDHLKPENIRKQTAQEILDTIKDVLWKKEGSVFMAMGIIKQRYGLEGVSDES